MNATIKFADNGSINPIFKMGLGEKAVMSTGHRSEETNKFLKDYMGSLVDIQINKSVVSVIGEDQRYDIDVRARHEAQMR